MSSNQSYQTQQWSSLDAAELSRVKEDFFFDDIDSTEILQKDLSFYPGYKLLRFVAAEGNGNKQTTHYVYAPGLTLQLNSVNGLTLLNRKGIARITKENVLDYVRFILDICGNTLIDSLDHPRFDEATIENVGGALGLERLRGFVKTSVEEIPGGYKVDCAYWHQSWFKSASFLIAPQRGCERIVDSRDITNFYTLGAQVQEQIYPNETSVDWNVDNLWLLVQQNMQIQYSSKPQADRDMLLQHHPDMQLQQSEWRPLRSLKDVIWVSPLFFKEQEEINKHLTGKPFTVDEETEESYILSFCALSASSFHRLKVKLNKKKVQKLGEFKRKGQIEILSKKVLVTGLPNNWLIAKSSFQQIAYPTSKLEGWCIADKNENNAVLVDMNRQLFPLLDIKNTLLLFRPLPFYRDYWLCKLLSASHEQKNFFVLWKPGSTVPLDGNSLVLHRMNETVPLQLDVENVAEYLRFFCSQLTAEEGAFFIIEGSDHPWLRGINLEKAVLPAEEGAAKEVASPEEITSCMEKIRNMSFSEEESFYETEVCCGYGQGLFMVKFRISRRGEVEMQADTPLLDLSEAGQVAWYDDIDWMHGFLLHSSYQKYLEGSLSVVTAKEIQKTAQEKSQIVIQDNTILGELDFEGIELTKISFENCRFRGRANFSAMSCALKMEVRSCTFESGWNLDEAHIRGGIEVDRTTILAGIEQGGRYFSVLGDRLKSLYLLITDCSFSGTVSFKSMDLDGEFAVRRLYSLGSLTLEKSTIGGGVEFISSRTQPDHLSRCAIVGYLDMESIEARHVLINKVPIRGTVYFKDAQIHLGISFKDLNVSNHVNFNSVRARSIDFTGGEVNGSLDFSYGQIDLGLLLHNLTISGKATFETVKTGRIYFKGISVGEDLSARFAVVEQYIHFDSISQGRQKQVSSIGGELNFYGASVAQNYLALTGVKVKGNVHLNFVKVGTGIFIRPNKGYPLPNTIEGDLQIGGAKAPEGVFLEGVNIGGELNAKALFCGDFRVIPSFNVVDNAKAENSDTAKMRLKLLPTVVGSSATLDQTRVAGDMLVTAFSSYRKSMQRMTIEGSLKFYDQRGKFIEGLKKQYQELLQQLNTNYPQEFVHEQCDMTPALSSCSFPFGINLRKSVIGGDLDLSNLDCVNGIIELTDTRVAHDILITSNGLLTTKTCSIEAKSLYCGGDIDITALDLSYRQSDQINSCERPGSVNAEKATVEGRFLCVKGSAYAVIPYQLNLALSQVGTLVISDDSFPLQTSAEIESADSYDIASKAIVLRQACIDSLEVVYSKEGESFPRPVDLVFAQVKYWHFHNKFDVAEVGSRDSTDSYVEKYVNFLGKSPFHRYPYLALESTLFSQGHEDEADKIYEAMNARLLDESFREGNSVFIRLIKAPFIFFGKGWGALTGYGTNASPLLVVITCWWLISSYLFSLPGNMSPSEWGLAMTESPPVLEAHPNEETWNFIDGAFVAFRYHIPIINLEVRNEWEPSSQRALTLDGSASNSIGSITGEDYAYIVVLAHWVLFPMVVFTISKRILRRRSSE